MSYISCPICSVNLGYLCLQYDVSYVFITNRNVHKIKGHPSLQKGGCHEAHDIEDLVKVGQVVKGFFLLYFFSDNLCHGAANIIL